MQPLFDIPLFTQDNIDETLQGKPGEAFALFVAELLILKGEQITTLPTAGNDGCIDHIKFRTNDCHVIECKDLSDGDNAPSAWKEVAKTLEKNLTTDDKPVKGQPQFEPWFNTKTPVIKYSFYVGAEIKTAAKINVLKAAIPEFFKQLAKDHKHLAHLKDIETEVLLWNDIEREASKFPRLCYRWFTDYRIEGLLPFTDDDTKAKGFSPFLHKSTLAYLPSDDIEQQPQQLLKRFDDQNTTGLIITGVGGIGKTRLVLETGRTAQQHKTNGKADWLVLQINASRCDQTAIDRLVKRIPVEQRVLFLCDYAEAQQKLTEILQAIQEHNDNGSQLNYIANCRSSYYPQLSALEDHEEIELEDNLNDQDQPASIADGNFSAKVVDHILRKSKIENPETFIPLCIGLPVLAVFIVWLHNHGQSNDLTLLREEKSFEKWIIRRLQIAVGTTDRKLALNLIQLIPQYPMPVAGIAVLDEQHKDLWDIHGRLLTDGWIYEDDKQTYHLAHDVFADQILLEGLKLCRKSRQKSDAIGKSFDLAAMLNNTSSTLMAWQRLATDITKVSWLAIFEKQLLQAPEQWQSKQHLLVAFPALTLSDLVEFKQKSPDFWQAGATSYAFRDAFGDKARRTAADGETVPAEVIPWLDSLIVASNYRDGRLLNSAISLSPEGFQQQLCIFLANNEVVYATGFIIASWLRAKGSIAVITKPLEEWLKTESHQVSRIASYIYPHWLKNGGGLNVVAVGVKVWLSQNQSQFDAQFVYHAWLEAGGDKVVVESSIQVWLAEHQVTLVAGFVFAAWLNAQGDKVVVGSAIKAWLKEHQTNKAAQFVFDAWLNVQGDKAVVEAAIKAWLEEHQTIPAADFVINAWLKAQGDIAVVEAAIKVWLEEYQTILEARFVFVAWLKAQGDTAVVESAIKAWLEKHQEIEKAGFVFVTWLDVQGDKAVVASAIKAWLEKNPTLQETDFVCRAWLNAKGDLEVVEFAIKAWLAMHQTDLEACYIYSAWLNAKGDILLVKPFIKAWLAKHQTASEADFVCRSWLKAKGDSLIVKPAVKAWLEKYQDDPEADFIFNAWLKAGGDKQLVTDSIKAWLKKYETSPTLILSIPLGSMQKVIDH
ncbi:MAG: hypothetical protein MJK04_01740 [Psychrosphaera sp.]|nr:hypothetical protein [Psychrosphaera sp.]